MAAVKGSVPMLISLIYLIFNWNNISVLERLAFMNFAVIFWHQFEEYRFPGGEPAIINLATQPLPEGPDDRYPLNQNNAMIINVAASYIVYLLPVIFPNVMWIGFMLKIGYGILQKPDSIYPFPTDEFERGGYAKKIRALNDKRKEASSKDETS